MLFWGAVVIGAFIYLNVGYAYGKLSRGLTKRGDHNWDSAHWLLKLVCFPKQFLDCDRWLSSDIFADSDSENEYLTLMSLLWPIKFVWLVAVSIIYGLIFKGIIYYVFYKIILTTFGRLLNVTFKGVLFLAGILYKMKLQNLITFPYKLFSFFREKLERRQKVKTEKRRLKETEAQAKAEKLSKQDKLRRLKRENIEMGDKLIVLQDRIAKLEAEIELEGGSPFRSSAPTEEVVRPN